MPSIDDLGTKTKARLQYRPWDVQRLRRDRQDHRLYRRPGGDQDDIHSPELQRNLSSSPRAEPHRTNSRRF